MAIRLRPYKEKLTRSPSNGQSEFCWCKTLQEPRLLPVATVLASWVQCAERSVCLCGSELKRCGDDGRLLSAHYLRLGPHAGMFVEASELDFTADLDDAEDFQLSEAENSDRFGQSISDEALYEAIAKRVPYKTQKTTECVVSVFRLGMVLGRSAASTNMPA